MNFLIAYLMGSLLFTGTVLSPLTALASVNSVIETLGNKPKCTLTAPATATAATNFTISWDLKSLGSATIVREDGVTVATATQAVGSSSIWATNVLGAHTYSVFVPSSKKAMCQATVNFAYTPAPVTGYDIVIVAGQSNAEGRGQGPFTSPDWSLLSSKVEQVGRFGGSNMKVVPIGYQQDGVMYDGLQSWERAQANTRMGFDVSFAQLYAQQDLQPGRKILIVPVAHGETSVSQWLGTAAQPTDVRGTTLYDDMIARVNYARALPGDNRVVAVLWQQGEEDILENFHRAPGNLTPTQYQASLNTLFSNIRRDVPSSTTYPILAGLPVPTWLNTSRAATKIIAQFVTSIKGATAADPLAGIVDSSGLTSNEDIGMDGGSVHFNAQSQETLGTRYFADYASLLAPPISAPATK